MAEAFELTLERRFTKADSQATNEDIILVQPNFAKYTYDYQFILGSMDNTHLPWRLAMFALKQVTTILTGKFLKLIAIERLKFMNLNEFKS